ncbi:protein disulfide-isomerase domain [Spizellomyces punctatus DAOM BR117]|uniref:Protein disulfide-isomerase domain n=1 Tax=Spizellomyces punctatus (strain DAOM BR117) TaxID=645134 RepID=A0A0L0HQV3_SPIPD|nr:protein disulfide-isomerase domain [Spizellomyces punctatus DAOM BR117]KND03453.1 protein disulfide-isomerase domain [Spizellomyces punctatus DAOM BR117]|eukprot:XP_016611492.1 protein disulfide-isomerase domain [Spizellomyces punctatus DAOM BR117]
MRVVVLLFCIFFAWAGLVSVNGNAEMEQAYKEAEPQVTFIDPNEFTTTISKGAWLVFFGSKSCPHCRKFTPTWLEAQRKVKAMKKDFHLGKVECTGRAVNEDLCTDQKIEFYPTVKLYLNGKLMDTPDDIKEISKLMNYIESKITVLLPGSEPQQKSADSGQSKEDKAAVNREQEALVKQERAATDSLNEAIKELQAIVDASTKPNRGINPDGRFVQLTEKTFAIMTNNTPWFVMFHAPWCPHCQKLKPVFEDLAPALKGLVNVGEVDCTREGSICKQFGVRGYPTLKFLQQPSPPIEYRGSRSFDALRDYALGFSSQPAFTPVKASEIPAIWKQKEVSYFLLYDPRTMPKSALNAVITVAKALRNEASFFVTPDSAARELFKAPPSGPYLFAVKDHGDTLIRHTGDLDDTLAARQYIRQFVLDNRYPRVLHLDSDNQEQVLGGDKLVVMAIIDPSSPRSGSVLKTLKDSSIAWSKKEKEENMHNLVVVTWLDGVKWHNYIERVYGISQDQLPTLIIADPKEDKYYDTDKGGRGIGFEKESLLQNINDILEGTASPKYTSGFLGRLGYNISKGIDRSMVFLKSNMMLLLVFGGLFVAFYMAGGVPGFRRPRQDPKAE